MSRLPAGAFGRGRVAPTIVLVLYLAVLLSSPFFHHDLACHQRTPGHCQACRANPPAPWAGPTLALVELTLDDLGAIESAASAALAWHVPVSSPGRSPPA